MPLKLKNANKIFKIEPRFFKKNSDYSRISRIIELLCWKELPIKPKKTTTETKSGKKTRLTTIKPSLLSNLQKISSKETFKKSRMIEKNTLWLKLTKETTSCLKWAKNFPTPQMRSCFSAKVGIITSKCLPISLWTCQSRLTSNKFKESLSYVTNYWTKSWTPETWREKTLQIGLKCTKTTQVKLKKMLKAWMTPWTYYPIK